MCTLEYTTSDVCLAQNPGGTMSVFKISGGNAERLSPADRKKLGKTCKSRSAQIKAAQQRALKKLYEERQSQGPRRYDYEYDDLQTFKQAAKVFRPNVLAPWEGPSQFQK
jgi:hypothetical protein